MPQFIGSEPKNKGELKVFRSIGRQLDDDWLISSSLRYASHENGRIIDREIDILLAHPKFGIFVLEIKEGILERTPTGGWLHWRQSTGTKDPTNAFDQVHAARRQLFEILKKENVFRSQNLKIATYVIFLDVKRPDGPLGPREQPILVFGDEVDSLLSRIELDWPKQDQSIFDMEKFKNVLFPSVLPMVYTPEIESLEISKIRELLSGFPGFLEKLENNLSKEDLLQELDKLRNEISRIPKIPPPGNYGASKELSVVNSRLDDFADQLGKIFNVVNMDSSIIHESDNETVTIEIHRLRNLVEDFSQKFEQDRNAKSIEVSVDLTSIENKLNQLNASLTELRNESSGKENITSFSSVQSQIGILTARIAQLSKVVSISAVPVDKFEMKLDRLAQLYSEATARLEDAIQDGSPDIGISTALKNEMRVMQEHLHAIATKQPPSPIVISRDRPLLVKSRLAPSMALVAMVAVFAVGTAAVSAFIGNRSQDSMGVLEESPLDTRLQAPLDISVTATTDPILISTSSIPISQVTESTNTVPAAQTSVLNTVSSTMLVVSSTTITSTSVPVAIDLIVKQVVMGAKHTCVLDSSNNVFCWGSNTNGQLGNGGIGMSYSVNPVKLNVSKSITQIASGKFHNCALNVAGDVFCWGNNSSGQLGIDSTVYALATPSKVVGGIKFKSISAGSNFSCGLSTVGEAWCWGNNSSNQLAANVGYSSEIPVLVGGGWIFKSIFSGEDSMTCGIEVSGRVLCWGIGNGGYIVDDASPKEIDLYKARYLNSIMSVGAGHMCLVSDGTNLRCYSIYSNDLKGVGSNSAGMGLSKGTLIDPLVSLSLGRDESCGLNQSGEAYCWGLIPTIVNSEQKFLSIDVYGSRKCALNIKYKLFCWGEDADGRSYTGFITLDPTLIDLKIRN